MVEIAFSPILFGLNPMLYTQSGIGFSCSRVYPYSAHSTQSIIASFLYDTAIVMVIEKVCLDNITLRELYSLKLSACWRHCDNSLLYHKCTAAQLWILLFVIMKLSINPPVYYNETFNKIKCLKEIKLPRFLLLEFLEVE